MKYPDEIHRAIHRSLTDDATVEIIVRYCAKVARRAQQGAMVFDGPDPDVAILEEFDLK